MQNKNKKRTESTSRDEHHSLAMREELKLGNLITWLGLASGFASILLSITGRFVLAGILIAVSMICDFFDGRMARKAHKATAFGTEIDSLTDIISFGMAPAMLGFMHYTATFAITAYFINISAGVFRLARYNILHREHYYVGMPITWNAVIILITVFLLPQAIWPYMYLASAVLMASPFKIRKI
ncbi:Archaetidylserine synthase [uncultured archaeon]|nr:Archaetidylserine synthase [uncultured archaeon]